MLARIVLPALAAAALISGCASNQLPPVSSSTGAAQAVAQNKDDDVVCIRQHVTGSHLAHVVCMTKAERERAMNNDRRDYTNMTAPTMSGPNACRGPKCL